MRLAGRFFEFVDLRRCSLSSAAALWRLAFASAFSSAFASAFSCSSSLLAELLDLAGVLADGVVRWSAWCSRRRASAARPSTLMICGPGRRLCSGSPSGRRAGRRSAPAAAPTGRRTAARSGAATPAQPAPSSRASRRRAARQPCAGARAAAGARSRARRGTRAARARRLPAGQAVALVGDQRRRSSWRRSDSRTAPARGSSWPRAAAGQLRVLIRRLRGRIRACASRAGPRTAPAWSRTRRGRRGT